MNTAIVIVTYNRLSLLKECVDRALNQISEQVEIYVIDNASTDGTTDYLRRKKCENENLFVRTMETNLGGAGGFSEGLQFAYQSSDCEMFLLIDDDAMLEEDFLLQIDINYSNKYGAYSGTVYVGGEIDTSHRLRNNTGRVEAIYYEKGNFVCDIATFCGLAVTREIVDKIGFPRGDYFIWNDDTEYSYRIAKYSRILNVSTARINHKTINIEKRSGIVKDNWKEYYGLRNIISIYKEYRLYRLLIKKIAKCLGKASFFKYMALSNKAIRNVYNYNAQLRIDAVKDGLSERLGKNIKYLP